MNYPVIRGAAYCLFHAPDMLINQGSTQTSEKRTNKDSDHLKNLSKVLRSYDDVVKYPPNQVYIGNRTPEELAAIPTPWYENPLDNVSRDGKYGGIFTEDELIGLMKVVDVFGLVILEESFQASCKAKLTVKKEFTKIKGMDNLDKGAATFSEVEEMVKKGAEPLFDGGRLVGCVKKAHDFDAALTSHVMFENLVSKASAVATGMELFAKTGLDPEDVDYIIECSEEACGDMNQRGGGNFAKAIGESCGCLNATGSDVRSFCAAPAHAMVMAGALIQSGVYKNVLIVAGGSSNKLGMNSKSHIAKNVPVLEDVVGTFAIHMSENDGVSPILRTDAVGRHNIGSGSSPQAVLTAIVTDPIDKAGITLKDVDKFSPELQNPEVTKPAGAGDVPEANFKMIAALGVKRGDFERSEIPEVVRTKGMPGYAPTQGHIPSGVPFVGFARDMILDGEIQRVMIIGKGSLFLGRLTNLFDGVSFLMEKNPGKAEPAAAFDKEEVRKMVASAMRDFAKSLDAE